MADDDLREEPVDRRTVFDGRLLHVYADTVRLPDGRTASREIVGHRGAVAIVATDGAGRVVLVRQWRHAVGRALWEVPAGTREAGETPEVTARRELTEETGMVASRWRELGHGPVSPGYSAEEIWFFAAEGLTEGAAATDEDENLEVGAFTSAQLLELHAGGDLDLKTLAAFWLAGVAVGTPG
ncbi:MAG: NUDIX domain-containing protein [Candidatus Dormibacteria bacterium]